LPQHPGHARGREPTSPQLPGRAGGTDRAPWQDAGARTAPGWRGPAAAAGVLPGALCSPGGSSKSPSSQQPGQGDIPGTGVAHIAAGAAAPEREGQGSQGSIPGSGSITPSERGAQQAAGGLAPLCCREGAIQFPSTEPTPCPAVTPLGCWGQAQCRSAPGAAGSRPRGSGHISHGTGSPCSAFPSRPSGSHSRHSERRPRPQAPQPAGRLPSPGLTHAGPTLPAAVAASAKRQRHAASAARSRVRAGDGAQGLCRGCWSRHPPQHRSRCPCASTSGAKGCSC